MATSTIGNLVTQDQYVDALTIGPDFSATGIKYAVANQPALVQFALGEPGQWYWSEPETIELPNIYARDECLGVRFRTAVAGSPARILAEIARAGTQPKITQIAPLTGILGASGSISPAPANVNIQHNGAVVGSEQTLDFEDGAGGKILWVVTDDAGATRVKVQPSFVGIDVKRNAGAVVGTRPALDFEDAAANLAGTQLLTWVVTDDAGSGMVKVQPLFVGRQELDYAEQVSNVTVSHGTQATADQLVIGNSKAYDSSAKWIKFFCPGVTNGTTSGTMTFIVKRGATVIGNLNWYSATTDGERMVEFMVPDRTPPANTYAYEVDAFLASGGNTVCHAQAGGSGNRFPMHICVEKA